MLPVRQDILPISAFPFDCSINIWHARRQGLAHCWLNNALDKNFRNYSQQRWSIVSPAPWGETSRLAAAVIVTRAHCCLSATGHCYVMIGTIKFVEKSVNDNSGRRYHCDVIASRSASCVATGVPHSEVELQTEFKSFTAVHLGSNTNQHTDWALGGTCIKSRRSVMPLI